MITSSIHISPIFGIIDSPSFRIINDQVFYNPWLNIIASVLGYLSFGTIAYACHKKRVLGTHMHHVLPMLIFVLLCDLLELGRTVYFLCNLKEHTSLKTTFTACTLHFWLSSLHFMLPYVQAVVAIHRFIVGFCGKPLSVYTIYIGLGLIFAAQTFFIAGDLLFGIATPLETVPHPVSCPSMLSMVNRYYIFIPYIAIAIAEAITIILSTIHIVKGIVKRQPDFGVSVFLLSSSPAVLSALLLAITYVLFGDKNQYILSVVHFLWDCTFVVIYHIEDFRLLALCVFAIFIIGDIRKAVHCTVSEGIRATVCRKRKSTVVGNEIHLETEEKKQMLEVIQP